jgi:hypothetical protein
LLRQHIRRRRFGTVILGDLVPFNCSQASSKPEAKVDSCEAIAEETLVQKAGSASLTLIFFGFFLPDMFLSSSPSQFSRPMSHVSLRFDFCLLVASAAGFSSPLSWWSQS